MGFRVLPDGTILCDTAEEAAEVSRLRASNGESPRGLKQHQRDSGDGQSHVGSRWTEARISDFFKLIKGQQRKIIDALLENADGRTEDQLYQLVGVSDGRGLAGVLTGLHKNAKKAGGDPRELYERKTVQIGDKRVREYVLTAAFRAAAQGRH